MSVWSSIPKESMANESNCGGVTVLDRQMIVTIAWIFDSRPIEASEPTRAVSMIMKMKSCQRSWPTRAQMNTTIKDETSQRSVHRKYKDHLGKILMVPRGIISEYNPFVIGSGPVNKSWLWRGHLHS